MKLACRSHIPTLLFFYLFFSLCSFNVNSDVQAEPLPAKVSIDDDGSSSASVPKNVEVKKSRPIENDGIKEEALHEEREKRLLEIFKEMIESGEKSSALAPVLSPVLSATDHLINDLLINSLIKPSYKYSLEMKDTVNHHVIDPVRKGKHFFSYVNSVMLGTFTDMTYENTGGQSTPLHFLWGMFFKNIISDFKLGSEVISPGTLDYRYHSHPLRVKRLGADNRRVANIMKGTHQSELVVIDVVKPYRMAFNLFSEDEDLEENDQDEEVIDEYEINNEKEVKKEYKMVDEYEDKKNQSHLQALESPLPKLYKFFYATDRRVTKVNHPVHFEDTDFFNETGRYEESDRTFLYHWNKAYSEKNSYRSGQIVKVDRKGYFSMGAVPIAWNYCEVLLHEGGTKPKKVLLQRHEKEIFYGHSYRSPWGVRAENKKQFERTRTVRRKVIKQVPNVNKFRVYTENLCRAAEASVRSQSEVLVYASKRKFSWLVPGLVFMGAPGLAFLISRTKDMSKYSSITFGLAVTFLLTSLVFPSMWKSEVPDTIHSIRFVPYGQ